MIRIELETWEALAILDPIQASATDELKRAARLTGEDAEYASIRAQVRQRIASQIADAVLGPDPRRVILEEEIALGMV